ncbi:HAD family hydrolase [Krasilnikovia sp. M28-CT-15]|uniref:HAD family hydrolase n=1 Tax=Krasilnikovia sp. M28-CT-15 TaxID=3373540 RepID=UPI0038764BB1
MSDERPPTWTVVLDVDDTLYLERDYVASGFTALEPVVRDTFGRDGFAASAWRLFVSGHRGNIFDLALTDLDVSYTPGQMAQLVSAYRCHSPRISLLPDSREALDHLRRHGARIAVITDGPEASQSAKVAALGLRDHTDVVILTDTYGPGFGKPHPRSYLDVVARTRTDRYVYAADNPRKDFAAPAALDWTTVRIRRPGGLHEALPHGTDVQHVVPDLLAMLERVPVTGEHPAHC